jgi:hypothetical protein
MPPRYPAAAAPFADALLAPLSEVNARMDLWLALAARDRTIR